METALLLKFKKTTSFWQNIRKIKALLDLLWKRCSKLIKEDLDYIKVHKIALLLIANMLCYNFLLGLNLIPNLTTLLSHGVLRYMQALWHLNLQGKTKIEVLIIFHVFFPNFWLDIWDTIFVLERFQLKWIRNQNFISKNLLTLMWTEQLLLSRSSQGPFKQLK